MLVYYNSVPAGFENEKTTNSRQLFSAIVLNIALDKSMSNIALDKPVSNIAVGKPILQLNRLSVQTWTYLYVYHQYPPADHGCTALA